MSMFRKEEKASDNGFPPQVSGCFYPGDAFRLRREIAQYLEHGASAAAIVDDPDVVGILAPHAGIRFSGRVAGSAFSVLQGKPVSLVVILALNHRRFSEKISLLNRPVCHTPMGPVKIDTDAVEALRGLCPEVFEMNDDAFVGEHSLEVQLPFIQVTCPGVAILPMIVGVLEPFQSRAASEAMWKMFSNAADVRFVVSSDLSHFCSIDEANVYDERSLQLLESSDIDRWLQHALQPEKGMCGVHPMLLFLRFFERFPEEVRQVVRIAHENSGQTTGDLTRVVGYGAMAFSVTRGVREDALEFRGFGSGVLDRAKQKTLMQLAREAIVCELKGRSPEVSVPNGSWLLENGAAFVTLKSKGKLRGCVGHVSAQMPLFRCVMSVAVLAATRDTRFEPVTVDELDDIVLEISVLTPPQQTCPSDVVVGRDGLIVRLGTRSGLLLPQVPVEWGWDRETFLAHACMKANLPSDSWRLPETEICSFQAIVFSELDG